MAYIKEVTYTEERSIKTGDFQFMKPRLSMTAVLEEGDSHKKIMENLIKEVQSKLEEIKDEF